MTPCGDGKTPVNSPRRSRKTFPGNVKIKTETEAGQLPVASAFTGDSEVPQRNVVQRLGQAGHPVRVRSELESFFVLHVL